MTEEAVAGEEEVIAIHSVETLPEVAVVNVEQRTIGLENVPTLNNLVTRTVLSVVK